MTTPATSDAALCAELNDLLQLDHDAIQAYELAARGLKNPEFKSQIEAFKGDHERHIGELTSLITAHGGVPVQLPHLPTGPMKLAVQGLGDLGNDTSALLAFKSNERLSRDKYRRAAYKDQPADVLPILQRAAEDEARHYNWVTETLEQLGAGENTAAGKAQTAFEAGHAKAADLVEGAETVAMHGFEAARRGVMRAVGASGNLTSRLGTGGMRNVWIALGVGFLAAQVGGRTRSRGSRKSYAAGKGGGSLRTRPSYASSGSGSAATRSNGRTASSGSASGDYSSAGATGSGSSSTGYPGWPTG